MNKIVIQSENVLLLKLNYKVIASDVELRGIMFATTELYTGGKSGFFWFATKVLNPIF